MWPSGVNHQCPLRSVLRVPFFSAAGPSRQGREVHLIVIRAMGVAWAALLQYLLATNNAWDRVVGEKGLVPRNWQGLVDGLLHLHHRHWLVSSILLADEKDMLGAMRCVCRGFLALVSATFAAARARQAVFNFPPARLRSAALDLVVGDMAIVAYNMQRLLPGCWQCDPCVICLRTLAELMPKQSDLLHLAMTCRPHWRLLSKLLRGPWRPSAVMTTICDRAIASIEARFETDLQ